MRRRHVLALATALTIATALPATATNCVTLTIGPDPAGVQRVLERAGDESGAIRTDLVGTFLWVQYGSDGTDEYANTVSVELPAGAELVDVCDDGTITIVEVPASPDADPSAGTSTTIDLVDLWPDVQLRYGAR